MLYLLTGGGTLGSVTPLLATVPEIAKIDPAAKFIWVGTASGPEAKLVTEAGLEFQSFLSGKLRRYFDWKNFTDLFRIIGAFIQAWRLMGRRRPDVVVSAGGFVAPPIIWAAWCRGVPVHIHQMDVRPGLANRLAAPFARSMSVVFEKSLRDFSRVKPVVTGNPVRGWLTDVSPAMAKRFFGFRPDLPVLLVLGGGTGADSLNALVWRALPMLSGHLQILHQTGKGKGTKVQDAPAGYVQVELLTEEMRQAFGAADLVVTRAGMGTLTELAALGVPAVVIPMAGTHQEDNAAWYAEHGAIVQLHEPTLISKALAESVLALVHDQARLADMGMAMRSLCRPDAAKTLAKMVVTTAGAKKAI